MRAVAALVEGLEGVTVVAAPVDDARDRVDAEALDVVLQHDVDVLLEAARCDVVYDFLGSPSNFL